LPGLRLFAESESIAASGSRPDALGAPLKLVEVWLTRCEQQEACPAETDARPARGRTQWRIHSSAGFERRRFTSARCAFSARRRRSADLGRFVGLRGFG